MAEESKKDKDQEVQDILASLDTVLSGLKAPHPALPIEEKLKPPALEPPFCPTPVPEPLLPALEPGIPPLVSPPIKIELAPKAGIIPSAPKKPSPAKPAFPLPPFLGGEIQPPLASPEIKKPVELPVLPPAAQAGLVEAAADPTAPAGSKAEGIKIPDHASKDQIRRLAVVYTRSYAQRKDVFINFLDKAGETLSKKPLYFRKVFSQEIGEEGDLKILAEQIKAARAVAVLALLDGMTETRIAEIAEAITVAGLMFRAIPTADIQKKSLALDLLVDLMLLAHED
jgi:hypothetical protein